MNYNHQISVSSFQISVKISNSSQLNSMDKIITICLMASLIVMVRSQCCLKYSAGKCIQCPENMHLYKANCIFDIANCEQYNKGFDCSKCKNGYQYDTKSSKCVIVPPIVPPKTQDKYVEFPILIKQKEDPYSGTYLLVDDFLRFSKPEISNAETIGANYLKYQSGLVQIVIQYKSRLNIFYEVIAELNLPNIEPKIIKFLQIQKPTIIPPSPPVQQKFDPSIHSSSKAFIEFDLQVHKSNLNLKKVIGGFFTTQSTGTISYKLTYNGLFSGEQYEVIGKISTLFKVEIQKITQTKNATVTVNVNPKEQLANQLFYQEFNVNSDEDYYFPVVKDYLEGIRPQLKKLNIIKSEKTTKGSEYYYRVTFSNNGQQSFIYVVAFDQNTFTANLKQQNKSSNVVSKKYVKIEQNKILKDFHFLIVLDSLFQHSNKYKDAGMDNLQKYEDFSANLIQYNVEFQIEGYRWEISAEINTKSFVVKITRQNKSEKVSNISGNSTVFIQETKISNETQTSNNNLTNTKQVNETKNITSNESIIQTPIPKNITVTPTNIISIPNTVKQKGLGLTQVTASQALDSDYKNLLSTIQTVNNQLKNSDYIVGYYQSQGFLRTYSIYYQDRSSRSIFEAKISLDLLRRKSYLLSFGKM